MGKRFDFVDPSAAERAIQRIGLAALCDASPALEFAVQTADPDLAISQFERLVGAAANPTTLSASVLGASSTGLWMLLGSSRHLGSILAQNPEFALELAEGIPALPSREQMVRYGERLNKVASSFSHELDQHRWLKQRSTLAIAAHDLVGDVAQPEIWRAISGIADALVELTYQSCLKRYALEKGVFLEEQILIVAMGKLGGEELNYSSDIDLIFAISDEATEDQAAHAVRFCEGLCRSISQKMGRGELYRVDMRLRPFGGTGTLTPRMRSIEKYFEMYAESWEQLALVRSRPIVGPPHLRTRFEALREANCFKPMRNEMFLDDLKSLRIQIESQAGEEDIKRGRGGIRDIEFLTQLRQVLWGHRHPQVRERQTPDALRELAGAGAIGPEVVQELDAHYTFLRKLEHRCQLLDGAQTHVLPEDAVARLTVARLMDFGSVQELEAVLHSVRDSVRAIYESELGDHQISQVAPLGAVSGSLSRWIASIPETFADAIHGNRDSIARVERLVRLAPVLADEVKLDVGLLELIVSGEAAEGVAGQNKALRSARAQIGLQCVLDSETQFNKLWTAHAREFLKKMLGSFPALRVAHLGAFFGLGWQSDLDLLLVASAQADHAEAEKEAEAFLRLGSEMRRRSEPIEIDLRLRPDGKKGALVRTVAGLLSYLEAGMDPWERFVLHDATILTPDGRFESALMEIARRPFSRQDVHDLVAVKGRIEREVLAPQYRTRDIKHGEGGMEDLQWAWKLSDILLDWRASPVLHLDGMEVAEEHFCRTRFWMAMQGHDNDIVPENPDRLALLAEALGFECANAFLAHDQGVRSGVRAALNRTIAEVTD